MTEDDSLLLPEEEMFEHFRFVSDKKQGLLRVDRYITDHMEQTSRHRVPPDSRMRCFSAPFSHASCHADTTAKSV